MSSVKKYMVLGVILATMCGFIFFYYVAPAIWSLIRIWIQYPYYPYDRIIVPFYGDGNYTFIYPYYKWNISYYPTNTSSVPPTPAEIWVSDNATMNAQYFNATVGATYTWDGLEFKVSEVSPALAVLFAKPENRTLPWQ
jgi:hypothetical protein